MRGWASVVAVILLGGLAPAGGDANGKAEFLRWVGEIARAKKVSVCRTGELRYPGEAPGYFAALGDAERDELDQIVLFSNGKKHWSYAERAYTLSVGGGCQSPPVTWDALQSVNVRGQDLATNYFYSEQDVTFVDGEPVMLQYEYSDIDGSTSVDYLKATEHRVEWDRAEPGPTDESDNAMLIALPPGSHWLKSWKAPTFVPFGEKNRKGDADADLAVQALDMGKAGFRIVVDVTDDRAVPTPVRADARKLIRSDHLEIWWVPRDAQDARQLGIGMRADGSADVRWLMPSGSKEKLPAVRRTGSHFEIDFPLPAFGSDAPDNYNAIPFTVAFSDTDAPGAKQQTVIATSPVHWNQKETFGELRRISGNSRRFPVFGDPM